MREFTDHYEEEYLYLADLTHNAALVAWGKFFFNGKGKLLADKKIHMLEGQHGRHTSIGANCESYGSVKVEILDSAGEVVKGVQTDRTYGWITGLAADTQYTYRIVVPEATGARLWGEGHLWSYDEKVKESFETDRTYRCQFRTFPDPTADAGLTFVVIGDCGNGSKTQQKVAATLEWLVNEREVQLVILVGDTIYSKSGGSGDDDHEWLTTYYQPYRTVIDRIPFYPCMGNHDTNETFGEKQDDRLTLYDNLLVTERFISPPPGPRDASISPGLFYRFRYGAGIEFICLDTSKEKAITSKRLFEHEHHKTWVEQVLANPLGTPRWRLPFSHHPPYCKGPEHDEDETRLRFNVIPRCEANGIRAFFSGHEHNFQCISSPSQNAPVQCFVTGGGGGWRDDQPTIATDGFMNSWGGNDRGHLLIVTIREDEMLVEPIDENGKTLPTFNVQGNILPLEPISVRIP